MPLSEIVTGRIESQGVQRTSYRLELYNSAVWELETSQGTEYIDCDVADLPGITEFSGYPPAFYDYVECSDIRSGVRHDNRWQCRWTMPGCLDQGEQCIGESESDVLIQFLDNDDCGESDQPIADYIADAVSRLAELADDGDADAERFIRHYFDISTDE
jgi:hypothetical protein